MKDRSDFARGNVDDRKSNMSEDVEREVQNLSKKSEITTADLADLTKRHSDKAVDIIMELYNKRNQKINKKAKKVADYIVSNGYDNRHTKEYILNKIMDYKKDFKMSDEEFNRFKRIISDNVSFDASSNNSLYKTDALSQYNSRINRALGIKYEQSEGLKYDASEDPIVQDILNMEAKNKDLHERVFLSSLVYKDCAVHVINSEFDPKTQVASKYVSPVVAALFLSKIPYIERNMIMSNIGRIIKHRKLRKPIQGLDESLYQDIIMDPNDSVCDEQSPLTDLKKRFEVQIELWKSVLAFRSGQFYESSMSQIGNLIGTLEACRCNFFENPDLASNRDEGAIFRRLLSVFSCRPTIVSMSDYLPMMGQQNGLMTGFQHVPQITNITSLSVITVRLPVNYTDDDENNLASKDLSEGLQQVQWIQEKGKIIPKVNNVITSRGCLFFYVNRRQPSVNVTGYTQPVTFNKLPLTVSGLEVVNKTPVSFNDTMTVNNEEYVLRSVVCVEDMVVDVPSKSGSKKVPIITGSTTMTIKQDENAGSISNKCYIYDPFMATMGHIKEGSEGTKQIIGVKPISEIARFSFADNEGNTEPSFEVRASRKGTIFVYTKLNTDNDALC